MFVNTAEGRCKLKEQLKKSNLGGGIKGGWGFRVGGLGWLYPWVVLCGAHLLGGSSSVADVVN